MRPTPLHSRTSALAVQENWRDWAGYASAGSYLPHHTREYFAVRTSAALFDLSPMFKVEIEGRDSRAVLDRMLTRDVSELAPGRVAYSAWLDDEGYLLQDGNVVCLKDDHFRLTAAEPVVRWVTDCARGLEAKVRERTDDLAMLALQGPRARQILAAVTTGLKLNRMRYFAAGQGRIAGVPVTVSRTGFTGDLGFEIVVEGDVATLVWDALMEEGRRHALLPAGLMALDIARVEAGLPLLGVDFTPADLAHPEAKRVLPHEVGLEWAVSLTPGNDFVGRAALERHLENLPGGQAPTRYVGLSVDWPVLEELFADLGLRPDTPGHPASREAVPVRRDGQQIGQATSHVFSPLLRRQIALASLDSDVAIGDSVDLEMTVEYERRGARATVVDLPFFDPRRKKSILRSRSSKKNGKTGSGKGKS